MNPLTNHPQKQDFTRWRHFRFATGIAFRLLPSAANLVVHGLIPAIPMRRGWSLEELSKFLNERNDFVEQQAARVEHPCRNSRLPHEEIKNMNEADAGLNVKQVLIGAAGASAILAVSVVLFAGTMLGFEWWLTLIMASHVAVSFAIIGGWATAIATSTDEADDASIPAPKAVATNVADPVGIPIAPDRESLAA